MSPSQTHHPTSSSPKTAGPLAKVTAALPDVDKKTAAMAAAGVAAAAIGVAAVRKYRGRSGDAEPGLFEVTPGDEGWQVLAGDADGPASTHATKKEALAAARELANRERPSRLAVHRLDGTLQDTFSYAG